MRRGSIHIPVAENAVLGIDPNGIRAVGRLLGEKLIWITIAPHKRV